MPCPCTLGRTVTARRGHRAAPHPCRAALRRLAGGRRDRGLGAVAHGCYVFAARNEQARPAGGLKIGGEDGALDAALRLSAGIDRLNTAIGKSAYWLILVAVLVSTVNAIVRKAFDVSSNAWLELQWQLFGAVFMLCAAYTFLKNEHIRIDIVNSRLPKRVRDWIDLLGHFLFLMPFVLLDADRRHPVRDHLLSAERAVRAMPAGCRNGRPRS